MRGPDIWRTGLQRTCSHSYCPSQLCSSLLLHFFFFSSVSVDCITRSLSVTFLHGFSFCPHLIPSLSHFHFQSLVCCFHFFLSADLFPPPHIQASLHAHTHILHFQSPFLSLSVSGVTAGQAALRSPLPHAGESRRGGHWTSALTRLTSPLELRCAETREEGATRGQVLQQDLLSGHEAG